MDDDGGAGGVVTRPMAMCEGSPRHLHMHCAGAGISPLGSCRRKKGGAAGRLGVVCIQEASVARAQQQEDVDVALQPTKTVGLHHQLAAMGAAEHIRDEGSGNHWMAIAFFWNSEYATVGCVLMPTNRAEEADWFGQMQGITQHAARLQVWAEDWNIDLRTHDEVNNMLRGGSLATSTPAVWSLPCILPRGGGTPGPASPQGVRRDRHIRRRIEDGDEHAGHAQRPLDRA